MKPHFLLKASMPKMTADGSIMSGKLADESQLGQLASLFGPVNLPKKTFQAPKPPKKRYLEENYSQNNPVVEKVEKEQVISVNDEVPEKLSNDSLEGNENDVPEDTVDEDPSWRERLICWEQLSSRLDDKEVNNNTSKDQIRPSSRRGRARACKGQKYREFMWTNVMHHRRKSSRWELCQDILPTALPEEEDESEILKIDLKNSSLEERLQNSSDKFENKGTSMTNNAQLSDKSESPGIDYFYKKKKINRHFSNKFSLKEENQLLEEDSFKRDSSSPPLSTDSTPSIDSGSDDMTGSKKRKFRKQGIRRLEPGSSFKDTRVVEESGLATLANIASKKKKLKNEPLSESVK